jgi:GAG-pre-integrase domain
VADSTSKPTSFFDEVMAQFMAQLVARLTSTTLMSSTPPIASSGADGYNLPSLLATAVKPVNTIVKALTARLNPDKSWIVDPGTSKHMTLDATLFKTYNPISGRDKVQTTDGSLCPIAGVGDITCTSYLHLLSVFHVPNFTNNFLSVSQLVDDLNCVIFLSSTHVVLQGLKMRRVIGIGQRSEGLYRLKQGREDLNSRACLAETPELELILLHCRLGHIPFIILGKLYRKLYSTCNKNKLVCDVCEFVNHTRTIYLISGNRSSSCEVASLYGARWFITFIDYHGRMTCLYPLKSKDGVLERFKVFHKMVETQFEKKAKVLRLDNGTEV